MIKVIGGIGINPKKCGIAIGFKTATFNEWKGFFKIDKYDLKNNILEIEKIESDTKHGVLAKAGWTLVGDLALGGLGTLAGLAFGGKRKQLCVRIKLRDKREVLFTCKDSDYMYLYDLYMNTEKHLEVESNKSLTLEDLKLMKEDGIISEEEYKIKARKMAGLK